MSYDIDIFWVFLPYIFNVISKGVNNVFKLIDVGQVGHIKTFDGGDDIFDECCFFFAILDDGALGWIDILFNDSDSDSERSVIRCEMPIQMNWIIVQFQCSTS